MIPLTNPCLRIRNGNRVGFSTASHLFWRNGEMCNHRRHNRLRYRVFGPRIRSGCGMD
jgi:hypothetical protein